MKFSPVKVSLAGSGWILFYRRRRESSPYERLTGNFSALENDKSLFYSFSGNEYNVMIIFFFSIAAVRFGRVPKREKAKILAAMQSSRMKTQESKVLAEMTDDGKIIETIVRAHYDTCDYTRNKIEPFMAKARSNPSFAVCTGAVSCITIEFWGGI